MIQSRGKNKICLIKVNVHQNNLYQPVPINTLACEFPLIPKTIIIQKTWEHREHGEHREHRT